MKVNGKTVKAKAKVTRNPLFADEKHTGREPDWDTERARTMPTDQFDHLLRQSFYYYNYYYSQKDCKKHVVDWMKDPLYKFTKEDISAFIRASDMYIPQTACSLIMAHRKGMPFRGRQIEYIKDNINKALRGVQSTDPEVGADAKVEVYRPTIQDRLNEKTSELIGELEGQYDEMTQNTKFTFKTYDFLVANNVPQSQLNKYEEVFQARLTELKLAVEKQDDQLVEGYAHLKASEFKRYFVYIEQLLSDVDQYRRIKKATKKVRVKRAVSKEKVVAKLKYAKEDKGLKLVSVNPADIIGANALYCYDTKTRKLIVYHADSLAGPLTIKGTRVVGFDTVKSISKTLRKPDEKLKEFVKANKVELRKFMDNIKAVDARANGRINSNQILLKVL